MSCPICGQNHDTSMCPVVGWNGTFPPAVKVDEQGRVVLSPPLEERIAAIEARLDKLEGKA
jgi:hypothetical protein